MNITDIDTICRGEHSEYFSQTAFQGRRIMGPSQTRNDVERRRLFLTQPWSKAIMDSDQ